MDSATEIQYGKRLVPVLIDEIAATDPDRTCFSFPRSGESNNGFIDISFKTVSPLISFWTEQS